MKKILKAEGFTLVELMIAIAIFGSVAAAGYSMYVSQQKSYVRQDLVAELQQNIRAAFYYLENDIRMAGYDPTEKASAGVTIAGPGQLAFTADIGGSRPTSTSTDASYDSIPDGTINSTAAVTERIRFALQNDENFDGIPDDNGVAALGKEFNGKGGLQPVIEGVERLEFLYHLIDGSTGTSISEVKLSEIRSVTISMLLRTAASISSADPSKDAYFYPASNPVSGSKWGPFNDRFLRRLVITEIKMRNMGLILSS